eukprot:353538-Chlamydomonas_euryale.AAC.4
MAPRACGDGGRLGRPALEAEREAMQAGRAWEARGPAYPLWSHTALRRVFETRGRRKERAARGALPGRRERSARWIVDRGGEGGGEQHSVSGVYPPLSLLPSRSRYFSAAAVDLTQKRP